jgi:hypothetical protein
MQERVEVPEAPEIDVAVRVQERLVELVVTARVTVPVKPFTGAMIMVEVPATAGFTITLVGLAVSVKS